MKTITIGSDIACDVCINKSSVASKQCSITEKDGSFSVSNLNPNYEVWVNGEKVEDTKSFDEITSLRVGDVLLQWNDIERDYENNHKVEAGEKERHGFVSFWLKFGIAVSFIMILVQLFAYSSLGKPEDMLGEKNLSGTVLEQLQSHVLTMQVIGIIGSVLLIFFYYKLLRWKKIGFWGFACTSVLANIFTLVFLNKIAEDYKELGLGMSVNLTFGGVVVISAIAIFVLWAILQIRKNGISCWKQLE